MSNKRIEALNSLDRNNYNSKYVTLSDNTKIGADLIKDLIKYFQLEFKNKYRYNYRRWILENIGSGEICTDDDVPVVQSVPVDQGVQVDQGDQVVPGDQVDQGDQVVPGNPVVPGVQGYQVVPGVQGDQVVPGVQGVQGGGSNCDDDVETMNKIIYKIIEGEGDDGIAINRLKKYIQKKYIQKKYNENSEDSDDIEIPDDIFNGDIGLRKNYRDSSINYGYIPVIRISDKDGSSVYFKPLLEYNYTNYDFQEKSQIYDDLNKLNGIFKKSNYKDIDDLVILDFYKEFTKKVEKLKDDIISRDDDVKYDLIDNIYDKLAIIYEIKIGRNKKVLKKPIKEILKEANETKPTSGQTKTPTKTPKDICDIDNKNLFNQILCEINKRAQIFNNLTTLKKGGKKARKEGGGGEGDGGADKVLDNDGEVKKLSNIINKLADATAGDKTQRYKAYLEIDKNILAGFINETKINEYITKLQNSKSLTKLSKITELIFKTPKKINGKIDKSNISFAAFNKFIEKIKDRMIDDSNRYLAIIKSLNIIMKKALGGSPSTNTEPKEEPKIKEGNAEQTEEAKRKYEKAIEKALEQTHAAIKAVNTAETTETVASAASTVSAKEAVKEAVNASEEVVKTIAIENTKIAEAITVVVKALNLVKKDANIEGTELNTALEALKTVLKTALEALKTSPEISGGAYQKEVSGNIRNQGNQGNQGNQKQGIGDKMPGNPGKEYLKNLTEIYINLAKEYGKFIKDESEIKNLIKLVIKSQEDIEKSSIDIQGEQSDAESLKAKIEEINKEYELRDKEQKSIEKGKNRVIALADKTGKEDENNPEKVSLKDNIQTEVKTYNNIFTVLTTIKDNLITLLKDKEKGKDKDKDKDKEKGKEEVTAKEEEFKNKKTELQAKEEEINKLIKNYRVRFGSGDNELASEETKKELEELENQNKENEKKSKNLEERKKQLTASLKVIKDELRKLYKACIDINLPYATEYNDFVKNIIKVGQLKYIIDDNPQINNNNEIIEVYNKEIDRIDKELGDIKIDITSNAKKINDKKEITKSQGQGINNRRYPGGGALYGGGTKEDDEEKSRLKPLLDGNLYKLITNDKLVGDNNLYAFISELKSVFDNDDDNDVGQDNASGKRYNEKETLYEQIWNDYSDGVKAYYNNQKDKNPLTYINEGEKLKNKVILYDLDPEIVLKITFQDKVVFLALMFAIRTMIMVLFEFLIDYNIVKSLRYAILIYAAVYILILLLFTAFVNLDSYKLRIVFNYLNMHINTPGIILHIMLFIIFSLLVIIIIQTDNFVNNLGDILDYTYIYNYIYTFNFDKILSGEFENNLTKDEKIKLQYRLDIISMLIFIFSGTLILLM